ncbi:hypothetical protein D0B32_10955 [Paraburkholderia sp. DHOC27]|nr:hypothetical protein D0B32_10955 [Paraburkholderia sp. DHOC27]
MRPIETASGLQAVKTISVAVDEPTYKAMRFLAVEQGCTVSSILREYAEHLTAAKTTSKLVR